MARIIKPILTGLMLTALFSTVARSQTVTAASCNSGDVQTAINNATEGQTVLIPAGTCTWTSGVTLSGKGINIEGAGSGRIIAYDNGAESLTVGTGTLSVAIAGFSPGFSGSSFTTGETLRVFQNNYQGNYMQGTVTSYSGTTLTMNITTTGGSGSATRWLVATMPSTTIVNNSTGSYLIQITEDTAFNTSLSGIQFTNASGTAEAVYVGFATGGQAVLIHDDWFQGNSTSNSIDTHDNKGVIWNCSFNGSTSSDNLLSVPTVHEHCDAVGGTTTSWSTPSTWGANDTTGLGSIYVETNDFHCLLMTDADSNSRMVFRYNLMDHSMFTTHGPDTSTWGQRYFELYDNTGVFYPYTNGTTFNVAGWVYLVRGGTFVIFDNTWPALSSEDWGNKSDVDMTVMNLQRNAGPDPCWGQNYSTAGQFYHAPRQIGMGYVTGTGTANYPADSVSSATTDSIGYVGDPEPAYIWGNSRAPLNVAITDYGSSGGCTGTVDTSTNYIVSGRDFYPNTAKPGYSPYTYPHPLTSGTTVSLTAPTNVKAVGH